MVVRYFCAESGICTLVSTAHGFARFEYQLSYGTSNTCRFGTILFRVVKRVSQLGTCFAVFEVNFGGSRQDEKVVHVSVCGPRQRQQCEIRACCRSLQRRLVMKRFPRLPSGSQMVM